MNEQNFLQCERLVMLYGSNPQMGTRPVENHLWFKIVGNRIGLTDRELYNMIYYKEHPTVKCHILYPHTKNEEQAIKWFISLSPEARLKQIQYRFEDWSKEQQQALAMAGTYD